jgi:hypothetical protein
LRINKEKSINIFTAIFIVAATVISYFISYNRVFFLNYREFTWQYIAIPVNYGIPLLLLIFLPISKAFRKKG